MSVDLNAGYGRIIRQALEFGVIKTRLGRTTLLIWNDQAHFDEWARLAEFSKDVRVATVKSSALPITLAPNIDQSKVAIVGIAFGVKADYSDTILRYHLVISSFLNSTKK
jgi:hypothetical protein